MLFHWRVQRLALCGRGSIAGLVASAFTPDSQLRGFCSQVGIDLESAPEGLRAALEHALARAPGEERSHANVLRRQALDLLSRSGG